MGYQECPSKLKLSFTSNGNFQKLSLTFAVSAPHIKLPIFTYGNVQCIFGYGNMTEHGGYIKLVKLVKIFSILLHILQRPILGL